MTTKFIFKFIFIVEFLWFMSVNAQINPNNNKISVDVSTQPQNKNFDYNACFALGKNLGMSSVGLHLTWTALETAPNIFNFSVLDIANGYYPSHNMPIDLNIDPLETNRLEVPSDLNNLTFDNPIFINRFKTLLDSIKIHLPNPSSLSSLIIGSEGDVYMGTNTILWQQYTTFYNTVTTYAKTLWVGLKISSELTFDGIINQNTSAKALNTNSDYIGVSYYPINSNFKVKPIATIALDFATLVNLYPSKPICFYQYGYPSSSYCGSSEPEQEKFISQTFTTWDTYASNIRLIDFTWLHDLDTSVVNYYSKYYGISDTVFLEFLHTIGLRTWNGNGTDKPAFLELECQAKKRGYNSLPITCKTGINDLRNINENIIDIFPNPVQDKLNIELNFDPLNAEIIIYNLLGQIETTISNINNRNINLETRDLANGLYFIMLKNSDILLKRNFFIYK